MSALYTVGYIGRQVPELIALQIQYDAIVVDTRLKPFSRDAEWNRDSLRKALSVGSYEWAEGLGNLHYRREDPPDIKLKNPAPWIEKIGTWLVSLDRNVILLCACPGAATCHRKVVAQLIAERFAIGAVHIPPKAREKKPDVQDRLF
jgi:uncharacterized protein (DUF488 family)